MWPAWRAQIWYHNMPMNLCHIWSAALHFLEIIMEHIDTSSNEIKTFTGDKNLDQVSCFNFLDLTINEFMNWSSYSAMISDKISRKLGIMNRLKRYLPFSAMKLMSDSLILSPQQFGITWWVSLSSHALPVQCSTLTHILQNRIGCRPLSIRI